MNDTRQTLDYEPTDPASVEPESVPFTCYRPRPLSRPRSRLRVVPMLAVMFGVLVGLAAIVEVLRWFI